MRLIDADSLIQSMLAFYGDYSGRLCRELETIIDNEPTIDAVPKEDYISMERTLARLQQGIADTVEVVRCKDCKHYKPFDKSKKFDCTQGLYAVFENDYCSHGERSEEWTKKK